MSRDNGGAAFPIPNDDRPGAYPAEPGMTLRDYFAAKAMQGMWASDTSDWSLPAGDEHVRAASAYRMADAMLKERAK